MVALMCSSILHKNLAYPTARNAVFYRSSSSGVRDTQFLVMSEITLIHERS